MTPVGRSTPMTRGVARPPQGAQTRNQAACSETDDWRIHDPLRDSSELTQLYRTETDPLGETRQTCQLELPLQTLALLRQGCSRPVVQQLEQMLHSR